MLSLATCSVAITFNILAVQIGSSRVVDRNDPTSIIGASCPSVAVALTSGHIRGLYSTSVIK